MSMKILAKPSVTKNWPRRMMEEEEVEGTNVADKFGLVKKR